MGKNDKQKNVTGEGGRKNEKGVNLPVINNVPNRNIMQRMNFLWQASVFLEGLGGSVGSRGGVAGAGTSTSGGGDDEVKSGSVERGLKVKIEKKKRARTTKKVVGCDLARIYARTMTIVGQRTTTKMDPSVKRTLCRGCSSVLIPGISARIRTRPSRQHEHLMIYTCLECGTSRRIPAPRNGVIASAGIGATLTGNIDTSMESVVEGLVQSSNPSYSHPVRHQQSHHRSGGKDHSEEHVGDKKEGAKDVQMNVLSDQQDHTKRNIIIPQEEEKTKSTARQKKTKKKKKKLPRPREPPLFARKNAGHVVYKGGEVIDMDGVYCV